MKASISVITLGVDDLDRAVTFYRDGLGLPTKGITGQEYPHGAVAFFELNKGLKLALWPRESLARETGLPVGKHSATECMLAHNVDSQAAVEEAMQQAAAAGALILKSPGFTFYGAYAGYFSDPDGHLWEVVYNPGFG